VCRYERRNIKGAVLLFHLFSLSLMYSLSACCSLARLFSGGVVVGGVRTATETEEEGLKEEEEEVLYFGRSNLTHTRK
jgi:hypothetical protein